MSWCPKCKMEYVEGVTVCPDCNELLVSQKESVRVLYTGEQYISQKMADFLQYSKITSAVLGDENEDGIPVLVSEEQFSEAIKCAKIFLEEETKTTAEITFIDSPEEPEILPEHSENMASASTPYVKKSEQYQDLSSSAITFFAVGLVGLAILILDITGILHLNFGAGKFLFYFVMGILFIGFLIIGFFTWRNARKIKTQIGEEITTTNEIITWFTNHYTGDSIDIEIFRGDTDKNLPEEIKYFKRTAYIKQELETKIAQLDEAYQDELTEQLYQKFYEN